MSKRGPRFSEKEKLAIVKEGEKNGAKAICAKYGFSDQAYRLWRKAFRIEPRKQFSLEDKHQILEEGFQNGIGQVCAAHRIADTTYYRWKTKLGFTKSPSRPGRPRRFSTEKLLAIVKEAEKTGVKAVCKKYGFSRQRYAVWRYQVTGIRSKKHFSQEEKLRILDEGYQNGILRTCTAYGIYLSDYYRWKQKFQFQKSPRRSFSEQERLQIIKDAIRDGITKTSDKHQLWGVTIQPISVLTGWSTSYSEPLRP
jgi:transposase-like protein